MDVYIHYTGLPENKPLEDVVEELNQVLDEHGVVCGGEEGRLDLELEEENVNPKYAQLAVKAYLQREGFPMDTTLEIGGMEIGIYL
jgi:predicted metal-dependent TIM-barrel fold hydrolase